MGIRDKESAFNTLKAFIRTDKFPLANYDCWSSSRYFWIEIFLEMINTILNLKNAIQILYNHGIDVIFMSNKF
jgi:hypothetical protein